MIEYIKRLLLGWISKPDSIVVECNSDNGKRWKDEDIVLLLSNTDLSEEEMSILLNRSIDSMRHKKARLLKQEEKEELL